MPLPASGEISLNDIHTEIARSAANNTEVSVSDNLVLTLGDVSTTVNQQGNYSFSDWHGKGNSITVTGMSGTTAWLEAQYFGTNQIPVLFRGQVTGNVGTYHYEVDHITTSDSDFSNGATNLTGTVDITNQTDGANGVVFAVDVFAAEAGGAEGHETFNLKIKYGASNATVEDSETITILDPGPNSHVITPSSTSQDEGTSITITVTAQDTPDGTTYYLHRVTPFNSSLTNADFSTSFPLAVTLNSGSGTATITTVNDTSIGEGSEQYELELRATTSTSSTLYATSPLLTINDTSFLIDITPSSTTMNEGSSISLGLSGAPNTTYYWTIDLPGSSVAAVDFSSSTSGSGTTNSSGSVTLSNVITAAADATTEGSETFTVQMRTGSTGGTVVDTTPTITISDTSTTALSEDSYYQMHLLRTITGQGSYWSTTSDSLASYAGQKGRLVFAYTNGTSGTSYRGDMQLDSISFDGNTYNFDAPSGHDWVTSTALNQTLVYSGMDPGNLGTFQQRIANYSTLATGENTYKWNVDSGGTSSGSTALSSANTGSYYVYAETSGTGTSGGQYTLASPLVQLSNSPGNASYAFARYGNNIGTTRVYWAQNQTTDAHPPPVAVDVYGPWTSTTTNSANWINGNSSSSVSLQYGQWGSISDGDTCRLLIAYISGNGYQADLQLDDWWANVTSTSTSISYAYPLSIDSTQSEVSNQLITYTSAAWNTSSAPTTSDIETIYNNSTWTNVGYGSSQGTWNLDRSGTPSGGTGLTNVYSSYYNYFEATGAGYSYKMRLLRSKPFSAIANRGFRGRIGHYGSNMGRMRVYIVKQ